MATRSITPDEVAVAIVEAMAKTSRWGSLDAAVKSEACDALGVDPHELEELLTDEVILACMDY